MLRVGISSGRGRGVFATRAIGAGEVIEEAPVIVVPADERELLKKTVLYSYYYQWGGAESGDSAICLGLGSIYNHSASPNAKYVRLFDRLVMRFVALRDIAAGEEILTNYNGDPACKAPLWFENRTG